jgi:predicted metal-dependent hydrolase
MHSLVEEGVRWFNEGQFFAAHEVWEEVWTPARGPERLFLQALIHVAVGLHHAQRHNREGARRQLRKGLKKLAGYLPEAGGIRTLALYRDTLACLERLERGEALFRFPLIAFSERRQSPGTDSHSGRQF